MPTVRQFVHQCYRLINPGNPTQPLHGDDEELAIIVLNQLLDFYASNGLMITIARTESINVGINQGEVTVGGANVIPTPDIPAGRLANLDSAWLTLTGVTYPLIYDSRNHYLAAWKYEPLQGLPRFIMLFPEVDVVRLRLYPAPSQVYQLSIRGKFQLTNVTANSDLSTLPSYYMRYLLPAVARDVSLYKGRADAWTPRLEQMYTEAKDVMESASEVNVEIIGDKESLLNGAWRVRAGI